MKASFVTNDRRAPGGLFVRHASSPPDNPNERHTLRDVIDRVEILTGRPIERAKPVASSSPVRGIFGVIKR